MRKSFSRYKMNNEEGQSFVEFALVLPLLILLVMGIIQFGIILGGNIAVSSAAREGARFAVQENLYDLDEDNSLIIEGDDETQIIEKVIEAAATYNLLEEVEAADIVIEIKENIEIATNGDTRFVDALSITLNGKVRIMVPFLADVLGDGTFYTVTSTTVMKVE